MKLKDIVKEILALMAAGGFFGLVFVLLFYPTAVTEASRDWIGALIIAVTVLAKEIYGHYFANDRRD